MTTKPATTIPELVAASNQLTDILSEVEASHERLREVQKTAHGVLFHAATVGDPQTIGASFLAFEHAKSMLAENREKLSQVQTAVDEARGKAVRALAAEAGLKVPEGPMEIHAEWR